MNRWTVTFEAEGRQTSAHHINEAEARAAAVRYEARGWPVVSVEPMAPAAFDALLADMMRPRP